MRFTRCSRFLRRTFRERDQSQNGSRISSRLVDATRDRSSGIRRKMITGRSALFATFDAVVPSRRSCASLPCVPRKIMSTFSVCAARQIISHGTPVFTQIPPSKPSGRFRASFSRSCCALSSSSRVTSRGASEYASTGKSFGMVTARMRTSSACMSAARASASRMTKLTPHEPSKPTKIRFMTDESASPMPNEVES